jgi:biopolymer transport protein ExbD
MESDKSTRVSKPVVDEDYLMNIMSGDEAVNNKNTNQSVEAKENKPKEKIRVSATKKRNYEEYFSLTDIRLDVVGKLCT